MNNKKTANQNFVNFIACLHKGTPVAKKKLEQKNFGNEVLSQTRKKNKTTSNHLFKFNFVF